MIKRIVYYDIVKGITIFLVVWMHIMQNFGHHLLDFYVPSIIYAFHMPVFMIIAGYFFERKLNNPFFEIIVSQGKRLIVPNIFWGGLMLSISSIYKEVTCLDILRLPLSCWFTFTLFACSILFLVCSKYIQSKPALAVFLSILVLFINGAEYLKFMVPFFGIGILFARYNIFDKVANIKWLVLLSLGSVFFLVLFWNSDYTIYCTPSPSLSTFFYMHYWYAFFIRILVGTSMTMSICIFFRIFEGFIPMIPIWNKLSVNSMGIYIIHSCIFTNLKDFIQLPEMSELLLTILSFLLTVPCIWGINQMISLLRLNKYLTRFFLGEKC